MITFGVGFGSESEFDRTVKGVRKAEQEYQSVPSSVNPQLPAAGNEPVFVRVTGGPIEEEDEDLEEGQISEAGLYHGVFVYEHEDDGTWYDDDTEGYCLVDSPNGEELVETKRYGGAVIGLRNDTPIVTVFSVPSESGGGGGAVTGDYINCAITTYLVTGDDTWQDVTGCSFSLPSAGSFMIECVATILASVSSGFGVVYLRLWNATTGTAVPHSSCLVVSSPQGVYIQGHTKGKMTVTGGDSIQLQAKRIGFAAITWSACTIYGSANIVAGSESGRVAFSYIQLS